MVPIRGSRAGRGTDESLAKGTNGKTKEDYLKDEIAADAYLIAQWKCDRTVIAELPGGGGTFLCPD